ncbi:MAG: hypothetical protein KDA73_17910 [Rhodobacteraceae bacterium]|nr:hypothetical protein [Paracoccaceae bacterium]
MKLRDSDCCIYCNSVEPGRTTEHIIPESLNGSIKFPKASCKRCQDIINREIENPLFGVQYKLVRSRYGYKSKHKQSEIPKPSIRNSISLILKRKYPPFQKIVPLDANDHPPVSAIVIFPPPPFSALKSDQDDRPEGASSRDIFIDYRTIYWNRIRAKKMELGRDPDTIEVSKTQFPSWTIAQFDRFLAKIACGAFFGLTPEPEHLELCGLRKLVLGRRISRPWPDLFTDTQSELGLAETELRIFERLDDGQRYIYCAFRFLSEEIPEAYLIRVRSRRIGTLFKTSLDYMK